MAGAEDTLGVGYLGGCQMRLLMVGALLGAACLPNEPGLLRWHMGCAIEKGLRLRKVLIVLRRQTCWPVREPDSPLEM